MKFPKIFTIIFFQVLYTATEKVESNGKKVLQTKTFNVNILNKYLNKYLFLLLNNNHFIAANVEHTFIGPRWLIQPTTTLRDSFPNKEISLRCHKQNIL